jgi:hypothetical protein
VQPHLARAADEQLQRAHRRAHEPHVALRRRGVRCEEPAQQWG